MKNNEKNILVLGANGKTGSRIVSRLENLNIQVRRGSRNAMPAFDWEKRETWPIALKGITDVYISFQPDLAVPGADAAIRLFITEAETAGVSKVVLLSGRGEPEAKRCEEVVIQSGIPYTIVRASWFNQNFNEGYLAEFIGGGMLALPTGGIREPFIDADDIADVVVAAFTETGHQNRIYEVTGPNLLTFAEAVQEIAAATGKQITYIDIPLQDYLAELKGYQLPEEVIELMAYLFGNVLDGRNASVTNGVQEALGRAPKDFREFARTAAENRAWDNQQVGLG
ncbi:NmrA family NAD(P)-binding protein [Mucilaginibacter kameinonensis]|uniref:NmrA family NAD(P)-binding protein n=1 Tax=Mucilaginibacter kameinonensis TaxID=452286 RepID=UPI000EF7E222|nr:NAD(P)H-binding protein [Mucilaginibacter kameinonensis]